MQPVVQHPGSFPVVETWGNPVLVELVQQLVAELVLAIQFLHH